jgi:hypothetical protein
MTPTTRTVISRSLVFLFAILCIAHKAAAKQVKGLIHDSTTVGTSPLAPRAQEEKPSADSSVSSALVPPKKSVQSFSNALFAELGGNGVFGSVNYERMIAERWAVRGGVGFFGTSGTNTSNEAVFNPFISLPFTAAYHLTFRTTERLEIGGGMTPFLSLSSAQIRETFSPEWLRGPVMSALTGLVAYRNQSPDGSFIFRIAVTPLYFLGEIPRSPFQIWAGLSAGFAF